jgi:transcriptional regulator with XRE-family HTH domain
VWQRPELAPVLAREQRRLGLRIRQLRREKGLTLESAAELMGVHDRHLARIERAETNPSLATLVAIASALRVAVGDLFPIRRARKA